MIKRSHVLLDLADYPVLRFGDQGSQLSFNSWILLKQITESRAPHNFLFGPCPFKVLARPSFKPRSRLLQSYFGCLNLCLPTPTNHAGKT
jgi:hypothetical protein